MYNIPSKYFLDGEIVGEFIRRNRLVGLGFEKVFRVSEKDLSNVQHAHLEWKDIIEVELRCLFSGYLGDGDFGSYGLGCQASRMSLFYMLSMQDFFVCVSDLPWIRG